MASWKLSTLYATRPVVEETRVKDGRSSELKNLELANPFSGSEDTMDLIPV